ncbi:FAD:protein FMN transferase [Eubacterium oxidoreducens]|uniref:FAD:protein FMN transferase n=1 Tax=Eubacterium oxidoreducens TaxID=1732 RepID=A0A1G6BT37_EUBOX|nr:FAD:protein FMN transferase [Eubacterium oxidoreducens]SDB23801.1 thiamine biosynthesis lipoprotein [Eubacterium oxidoreducens]
MKKRMIALFFIGILGLTALCGCSKASSDPSSTEGDTSASDNETYEVVDNGNDSYSLELFAMDTYMTLTAYGDQETCSDALIASATEINRLEDLFSTNIASSEVAQINANGGGSVSDETAYLIEKSLEYYEQTSGAYDITVYPLVYEWGFTTQDYKVPDQATISSLLELIGSDMLHIEDNTVTFDKEGMMIDLGTIAKGYASQQVMGIFEKYGITSGLVSLGGNVQTLNAKPDGSDWKVAIQNPDVYNGATDYMGVLEVTDKAVTTAGGYERYFEEDGIIYRHIFDPSTGCPTTSSLKSVTVVADDGTDADGYDTPLFVMDLEAATKFWQEHADDFSIILMDENDQVYVSEDIADDFSSDYDVTILKRK